jgi:SAM-dependent methyltransferase
MASRLYIKVRSDARDLRNFLRSVKYRGDRYEDPICGGTFESFETMRGRPDARCPRCLSLERHRVEWLYLTREIGLGSRSVKILHVAPEPGLARSIRRLPGLDYLSTDLRNPTAMVNADLTDLPFEAGSFDIVLCNHVLEHVPADRRAMEEIRRVLKGGGMAIMQHPIQRGRKATLEDPSIREPAERDRVYFHHDHVRLYGEDFARRLVDSGFARVESIHYQDQLPASEIERFRLVQFPSSEPERDLVLDTIHVATAPSA